MNAEQPVTLFQLISAVVLTLVAALSPQFYNIYSRYKDSKDKEKLDRIEER